MYHLNLMYSLWVLLFLPDFLCELNLEVTKAKNLKFLNSPLGISFADKIPEISKSSSTKLTQPEIRVFKNLC